LVRLFGDELSASARNLLPEGEDAAENSEGRVMKLQICALGAMVAFSSAAVGQSTAWRSKEPVEALAKRIDAHIAAAQQKAGVKPLAAADPAGFFRRLHLDLAGMIPTFIDSRGYVENTDPDKLWEWSERLLEDNPKSNIIADKTYSKHFAAVFRTHILAGANQQGQAFSPVFERWLRDRFEQNTGYDQLVRDILAPGAEGFGQGMVQFRGGAPGGSSAAAFYIGAESKAENLAGAASRVFLGVKLECAQCHPHPFAKWTKEQFWEFAAFFAGTQPGFNRFNAEGGVVKPAASTAREITIPGTNKVVKAKYLTGEDPAWKPGVPTRSVLADWITSAKNPYFAKATADFVWSYFFGVSLLEPILEPSPDSPITHPELLDEMAKALAEQNFDLKFLIRAIVHTQAYQRASDTTQPAGKDDDVLFVRMPVRGLSPEQLYDSIIEAVVGPAGHSEPPYQPGQMFGGPMTGNPRADFLAKFASTERRHESQTSILQALFLMNGKFLNEKLRNNPNIAILANEGPPERRIRMLYLMTLSRPPREEESRRLIAFLTQEGADPRERLTDILWAIVNSGEFRLNH
jgi:hypothetical protein